jgi:hypothetical protein
VGAAARPGAGRGDRLALRALVAAAVLVLTGCGSGDTIVVPNADEVDLEQFQAESEVPPYWVGPEFEGLPVTHAQFGTLIYGTCEIEDGGLFSDGGCAPPVQIQNMKFEPRDWAIAAGCKTLPSLRGVPTARHDGLVLFTGRQFVKIYAIDDAQARRIAQALRPMDEAAPKTMTPPPRAVARAIRQACD